MVRKRGFWIVLWLVLLIITGFLAFGLGPRDTVHGPWGNWMGGGSDVPRRDGAPLWYSAWPGVMVDHGAMMGERYAMSAPQLSSLTSEQAEKIAALRQDAAARARALEQEHRVIQNRLSTLYAADTRDWDAIRSTSRSLSELQRQQMEVAIDMQQEVEGLLTDSQRQELTRAWRSHGWMGGPRRE